MKLSLKCVLFLTSVSSILVLILTFSGNAFIKVFYVNSKYTLLAFSFLLLSCRDKNHFVINGSQIYVLIIIIIVIIIIIIIIIVIIIIIIIIIIITLCVRETIPLMWN